jgi:hypothetical protein
LIISALDGLSILLILAGGITFAATLGVHNCSDLYYTAQNTIITGSGDYQDQPLPDFEGRCHQAQAATAFLFFAVACFAGTAVLGVLRKDGAKGSIV